MPYRSSTDEPTAALASACSSGDSGADPDTHRRRRRSSVPRPDATSRWYMVGTPKNMEARFGQGRIGHRRRVEAGQQHGRGPGQEGAVDADTQAVGVEDGQAVDQPVVRGPPPGDPHRLGGGQQVPVTEHRPLRGTGGARRVADEGGRIGIRPRRAGRARPRGDRRPGPPRRRRAKRPAPTRPGPIVRRWRQPGGHRHDVDQLTPGVGRIGRDHHQPGPQSSHVGREGSHRRGGRPQHPVPRLQAGRAEAAGDPAGRRVELPGRPPARGPGRGAGSGVPTGWDHAPATAGPPERLPTAATRPATGCRPMPARPGSVRARRQGDHCQ